MKSGVELITEERAEQLSKHNWSLDHDSTEHKDGELVQAALIIAHDKRCLAALSELRGPEWAWTIRSNIWGDQIHRLKVAGALIAAEIDRIQALTL